jgi:acyl transferase domain-containing protein
LSIVVDSLQQLRVALDLVLAHLHGQNQAPLPPHIQLAGETSKENHRIAFSFPGQGAQYPDMAREVALYFKEMRSAVEFASGHLRHRFPKLLSQFIYPPSAYSKANEASNQQQLTDTHIAQPAIGAVEAGYMDLVARLGLKPDMVGGHSYGEYAALHAAGVISREEFLCLSENRGRVMSNACAAADGAMAAVQATREELLARLKDFGGVVIANHNAPLQSVISGNKQAVRQVVDSLNVAEIMARMLPVAGAFHSCLVASAQVSLATAIAAAKMQSPAIPVYANTTARPYDSEIDAIRSQLSNHLLNPVEFVAQINAMYEDGARIFVEVGPKSILTKLVGQILQGKNHTAVSLDGQGGGLRGLLLALGTLVTRGVDIKLTALFEGRDVRQLDLSRLAELTRKPELPPTAWLVNGGGVRPHTEDVSYSGKIPPLDRETATNASKVRTAAQPTLIPDRPAPASTESTAPSQLPAPTPAMTFQPTEPQASSSNSRASASNGSFSHSHSLDGRHNDNGAASRDAALVAYQAYQETMRQFLALQEQVMMQFLSGSQRGQIVPPPPAITPAPPTVAHASSTPVSRQSPQRGEQLSSNGRHSGNGAVMPSVQAPTPPVVNTPKSVAAHASSLNGGDPPSGDARRLATADARRLATADARRLATASLTLTLTLSQSPTEGNPPSGLSHRTRLAPQAIATPPVEPVPQVASGNHSALSDRASLTQTLLHLVSERTGYPAEMLGLDQDMEAELGIDSIKRVEIFGALLKSLPETLTASIQERIESFTQVKTLNGIVEELLQCLPTTVPTSAPSTVAPEIASPASPPPSASPSSSAQEESGLGKSPSGVETIPRYVMQARTEPLPKGGLVSGQAQGTAPTGLFLITEDKLTVAPYVSEALQQRGARTAIISSSKLLEPEQMAKEIAKLRQDYGPVTGIVHLAPLWAAPIFENLSDWRKYTQSQSKSLFQMLRLCAADLQQAGQQQVGRVLAASLLGGCFGRDRRCGPGLATGGSCNGLLKAMTTEWSNVRAKAIDFDDSLSPADMAQQIIKELLCFGGRLEVGYIQGNRTVFDTVKAPLKAGPAQLEPSADWVVLITGGARGITAEIASELVRPGMTMIVVGRMPEPKEESPEFDGIEDIAVLRRVLLDRARLEGLSPTPVQIEVKLKELLRNRTIRRNLESLRQAGARVEYCSVDVKYVMEFGTLIDSIYSRYGGLDVVIHGAGIIEDTAYFRFMRYSNNSL